MDVTFVLRYDDFMTDILRKSHGRSNDGHSQSKSMCSFALYYKLLEITDWHIQLVNCENNTSQHSRICNGSEGIPAATIWYSVDLLLYDLVTRTLCLRRHS
jgi:hypothetical protein